MTLISILIGLGLEYYLGTLDQFRNYTWFDRYCAWLELKCSKYDFWSGSLGVLLTLFLPLLMLFLLGMALDAISVILLYIFIICVFVYSLGSSLNILLNNYIDAIENGDESTRQTIELQLTGKVDNDSSSIVGSILVRAHDHVFGVIFWFIVLGMFGAVLFSLVVKLNNRFEEIHGGYGDTIRNLYKILLWPSARLMAIGFALGGSLVHALDGWRQIQGFTLDVSRELIVTSGACSMQFQAKGEEDDLDCIQETQALLNRSLIVWLTVLGIMTIGGWLV